MMEIDRKFKVILTDPGWPDMSCEEKKLGDIADLQMFRCRSEEELIRNCEDADALLVTYAPVSRHVIEKLKQCQVISVFAIGLDMVDVQAATEAKIPVTNVPDYCIEEVCDHTMALLLAAARKVVNYHRTVIQDKQWVHQLGKPIYRLREKSLGLIGFGKIPRAVAKRAQSFGLRVMAYDPYVMQKDFDHAGVIKAEIDDMLSQADFVSIHTPLTPETKELLNIDRLKLMKPSAVVINTSRGPIIEENALVRALKEGSIAGAALDVLQIEPPEEDNPLMNMENVILTPHAGFYSEEAIESLRSTAATAVRNVLMGQKPDNMVNPEVFKN